MRSDSKIKEVRGASRRQAMMRAHILDPEFGIVGVCFIHNISRTGAKLKMELEQEIAVPSSYFWLKIENEATLFYCTVKWQEDQYLGVEFSLKKHIETNADESKNLRHDMSWDNVERRSGRDRRAVPRSSDRRHNKTTNI